MEVWPNDWQHVRILDISQPIEPATACFPGDTPFSHQITVHHADSQILNLTQFTMSPHVGTHADAPSHLEGDLTATDQTAGNLPLAPYIGPALVVDVSPTTACLTLEQIRPHLLHWEKRLPPRLLFKTTQQLRHQVFESAYASIAPELAEWLGARGIQLVGLDTPSVDPVEAKVLATHHVLNRHGMVWLENLDLTQATPGLYTLVALPLKLMSLEASPVRAVLLSSEPD